MNIIIFGPPGAGKGTQSSFIVKKYKLHQLSTGELLRKEIKEKTKLGQQIESKINSGNLVSDETAGDLIEKYISSPNLLATISILSFGSIEYLGIYINSFIFILSYKL